MDIGLVLLEIWMKKKLYWFGSSRNLIGERATFKKPNFIMVQVKLFINQLEGERTKFTTE